MATRLYVGGLGERVTEEDLHKTFSHMGAIESVDIIRTKNRSFAYINFLPSSENSLLKLFSTYNGCLWKGGKLKLEKAKEHYTDRLKREWAEDAELLNSEDTKHSDVDENMAASLEPKSTLDLEKMQLRMFFPKLRKVKSLPFRGTGKHKYSFQRLAGPPRPVHICDCPDHYVDIKNDKVNPKKTNMPKSVMNSALNKGNSLKNRCIQPPRKAEVDDSRIQDDGLNDKEIQVMNSVMKKLLERDSVNTDQKNLQDSSQLIRENANAEQNLHDSPQLIVSTVELPEDKDKIEEETDDDDDITINTGAGQDFGSESWETSLVSKMARSNEQQTRDEPAKSKLCTQKTELMPSNKKRKSVLNDSSEENPASQILPKKVRFQIPSNDSEEQLELKSVTDSVTKKSIASGMWSQKSSWKKLVGDKSIGSFHLSLGGVTNNDEQPISVGETSTDSKKHESIINGIVEEHKPSNKSLSDEREHEKISNPVPENLDGLRKDRVELQAAQFPAGTSEGLDEVARGSSWLQKSPWTQLVRGGESSSFSLSQILPKDQLEKLKSNKSNYSTTSNNFFGDGAGFGKTRSSRSGLTGEDKKKDARASKGNVNSDSSILTKSDSEQKVSNSTPGVVISETCPFMRSADSLKDWQTAKAALTGALKKKNSKNGSSS